MANPTPSSAPTQAAAKSAITFAVIVTGALALGFGIVWRIQDRESVAFAQKSIESATTQLATQTKLELERLTANLTETAQAKLKPLATQPQPVLDPASPFNAIEADPGLTDLALWTKPEPNGPAHRAVLVLNSKSDAITQRWITTLQEDEAQERDRLDPAFHGQVVVLTEPTVRAPGAILFVAVPIGHGEVSEVVVAHTSVEKFQKIFSAAGFVQAFLIDRQGIALAHPDPIEMGKRETWVKGPLSPVYEAAANGSELSGHHVLTDENGASFYGGFRKVGVGGLVVMASVPASRSASALQPIRSQIWGYLLLIWVMLGVGRYTQLLKKARLASQSPVPQSDTEAVDSTSSSISAPVLPPRKIIAVALHGTLRGFNQLLEAQGAEEAADTLNDYLTLVAARVRHHHGYFERYAGTSFAATWELVPKDSETSLGQAIQCGLALRWDLTQLNEARKVDGQRTISHGLGLHVGQALAARIGAAPDLTYSLTGEALACARALDRLGLAAGKDFVISEIALKTAQGTLVGKQIGEARLTEETGLMPYYSVNSYGEPSLDVSKLKEPATGTIEMPKKERLSSGETRVHLLAPSAVPHRWLVNTGAQIIGPLTAAEIAARLFSQDIDFDCECWNEETGRASKIGEAAIFAGSLDAGAYLWVYDGQMMHGPMTEGFLQTALTHGALSRTAFVCETTTVNGWKPAQAYISGTSVA